MPSYKAFEWREAPNHLLRTSITLDQKTKHFDFLIGSTVLIHGTKYRVQHIVDVPEVPIHKKGEKIGVLVKRVDD